MAEKTLEKGREGGGKVNKGRKSKKGNTRKREVKGEKGKQISSEKKKKNVEENGLDLCQSR